MQQCLVPGRQVQRCLVPGRQVLAGLVVVGLLSGPWASPGYAADKERKENRRLIACHDVLREFIEMPEGFSSGLLQKAECVALIPGVKKVALGFGARFGKGAVLCRTRDGQGPWSAPLMLKLSGGSFGFQIGGQSSDVVLLVMNRRGIDHLLRSKFTLGVDASVAAGPKGRAAEAETDLHMQAEILSYSRSRGLFAGISLEGAVVKHDKKANRVVHGEAVEPRKLLLDPYYPVPAAGRPLVDLLHKRAPPHQ